MSWARLFETVVSQRSRVVVAAVAVYLVMWATTSLSGRMDKNNAMAEKTNAMLADHMASMAEQRWLLMQICLEGAKDETQRAFCTMRPLESHATATDGEVRR